MNKTMLQELPDFSLEAGQEELNLLSQHDLYFRTREANTPELIEAAHALRYQVYCLECKFENPAEHIGGLEIDAFDSHSTHGLLFHRQSEQAIGTVRIILPYDDGVNGLPIMRILRDNGFNLTDYLPLEKSVEVSRFAISKQFRRRLNDDQMSAKSAQQRSRFERDRQGYLPCLSLLQFLLRQSIEYGVTHWTAVLDLKLLRMFAGMGMRLTHIGPIIMHHGLRQPCYCHLPTMLEVMREEHFDYWNVMTDAGDLSEKCAKL